MNESCRYNRTDYAVLVYDVWSRAPNLMPTVSVDAAWPDRHGIRHLSSIEPPTNLQQTAAARPLYELAQNETAFSIAWFT